MIYFLPHNLPNLDALTLFGMAILFCHFMGELVSKLRFIPRISGYILSGIIAGPNLLNLVDNNIIFEMKFLTDIAIGVILFKIGRYLDLKWLFYDKGLLLTSIFEFILTSAGIYLLMYLFGWSTINSILVAIIASTTSPAIILLITRDLNSSGPITRRSLVVTSFNNFLAILVMALIYPFLKTGKHSFELLLLHSFYRITFSILLGIILFKIFEFFAIYVFSKNKQNQLILLISLLVIAAAFSRYLNLSAFLVLMTLGIATRNFDLRHAILEIDLSFFTQIFFIPLFFITGCYLDFSGFLKAPFIILAYILVRISIKTLTPVIFKNQSDLTSKQAFFIGGALMPLSITAFGIASELLDFKPNLGSQIILIISSAIGFFGIIGPIILQLVLLKSNELFDNLK